MPSTATRGRIGRRPGTARLIALLVALWAPAAFAQAPAAAAPATTAASAEDLDKLVGRIALYPDDLIAIILPASTNPLQIVQADRYLVKRKSDPKLAVDENWDDSVKSLLNYPEVVTSMSADLDWTSALGEAVVANQGSVLDAVQAFRRKAQAAGNLKTDAKQVVVVEKEVVKIVPADPQVIYVPQYNPTTVVVYGSTSAWGYYPSPYPVYYYPYPPGAAFATGLIWGAAISSAWNGNHYAAHYGGNANININRNTNINTGNINTGNINRGNASTRPANTAAAGGGSTAWKPNKQPGQVSSSVGASRPARAGEASASTRQSASAGSLNQVSARGGEGGGARASTGALDGYGSGRQTQMDSSRGASSRSTASASQRDAPSRSASPSASRQMSGGGGGMRGGGGGGGGRGSRR